MTIRMRLALGIALVVVLLALAYLLIALLTVPPILPQRDFPIGAVVMPVVGI